MTLITRISVFVDGRRFDFVCWSQRMNRAVSFPLLAKLLSGVIALSVSGSDVVNQAAPPTSVQAEPKRVDWSRFTTVDAVKRAVLGKTEDEVRETLGSPDDSNHHAAVINGISTDAYWIYAKRIPNKSTGGKDPVWVYFFKGKAVHAD